MELVHTTHRTGWYQVPSVGWRAMSIQGWQVKKELFTGLAESPWQGFVLQFLMPQRFTTLMKCTYRENEREINLPSFSCVSWGCWKRKSPGSNLGLKPISDVITEHSFTVCHAHFLMPNDREIFFLQKKKTLGWKQKTIEKKLWLVHPNLECWNKKTKHFPEIAGPPYTWAAGPKPFLQTIPDNRGRKLLTCPTPSGQCQEEATPIFLWLSEVLVTELFFFFTNGSVLCKLLNK